MPGVHIPVLEELEVAFESTRQVTIETPLLESELLAQRTGAARVFIKPESLQRTGSFKFRGAYWRIQQLSDDEKSRGVVAYSSGNFAQGLAAAAQLSGVEATIVMPVDAPEAKRRGAEAYGARIVLSEHGERPREDVASAMARALASDEGLTLLHPFDDPHIVAGQAGAGLEALAQLERIGVAPPEAVLCCVGGGGLIGGVALAFHYVAPGTQVFAVEPDGFDGLGRSISSGSLTRAAANTRTICDALQATAPGETPFAAAQGAGVLGLTVDDDIVRQAMRAAFEDLKLALEPSGAVALAALIKHAARFENRDVLVYATGGNIALADFFHYVQAA